MQHANIASSARTTIAHLTRTRMNTDKGRGWKVRGVEKIRKPDDCSAPCDYCDDCPAEECGKVLRKPRDNERKEEKHYIEPLPCPFCGQQRRP